MNPHLSAGIDAGASAIKVAVVRSRAGADADILATAVQRIRRRNIGEVVRATFDEACATAKLDPKQLGYVASTGDVDAVSFATGHFYGMTTHARGALHVIPSARAVLDLGALHARAIRMDERGKVLGHRMTSQCASGTGQFLENIARYLGVAIDDVGPLSLQGSSPEQVSGICAVLAETDVINMVSRGISTANILRGIHLSMAKRLIGLMRMIKTSGDVLITGGLARNTGFVTAMQELANQDKRLKATIKTHPDSVHAGAIGAALWAGYRHLRLEGQSIAQPEAA